MSTTANIFSGNAEDIVESITHEISLLSLICEKLNGVDYPFLKFIGAGGCNNDSASTQKAINKLLISRLRDNGYTPSVMENVCLNHAMSLFGNCVQSVTMSSIRNNRLLVKYATCSSQKFSNLVSSLLSSLDDGRCSQVADVKCCGATAVAVVHYFKNSVGSRGGNDFKNADTEITFYDELKRLIINICVVREFGDKMCDLNKLQELLKDAVLDPLLFFVISIVAVFWCVFSLVYFFSYLCHFLLPILCHFICHFRCCM